jgi:hypothetical protein
VAAYAVDVEQPPGELEYPRIVGIQVVKGRGEWKYWTGTPADLAEIGQLAIDLVGSRPQPTVEFNAEVSAPAFDARFFSPEQLRNGLKPEDLGDLTNIEIDVSDQDIATQSSRIAFTVARPQAGKVSGSVAKLFVTGPDRDWVDLATLRMSERISRGARATEKATKALLLGFVLLIAVAITVLSVWGDDNKGLNGAEITSIVLFSLSGVLLVLAGASSSIAPELELLPEGGLTRWQRIKARFNVSGKWIGDRLITAAIGAFIGILITRAF